MFNGDLTCMSDEKSIEVSNKLVADVASIASVLVGFEGDYAGKTEHITKKDFNTQVNEYINNLYNDYQDQLNLDFFSGVDIYGTKTVDDDMNVYGGDEDYMVYDFDEYVPEMEYPLYNQDRWMPHFP